MVGIYMVEAVHREKPSLCVVVPCYNEQEALPQSIPVLSSTLDDLISQGLAKEDSAVLFVDDGSADGTWQLISNASRQTFGGGLPLRNSPRA